MIINKFFLKIELVVVFLSISVMPLFPLITFISTKIFMPLLLGYYLFKNPLLLLKQPFVIFLVFMIVYGVIWGAWVPDVALYTTDISSVVVTLIYTMVLMYFVNNKEKKKVLFCNIFIFKFIFMIIYGLFYFDQLVIYVIDGQRVNSGQELGINANAFGYFGFIAIFCSLINYLITGQRKYFLLFFLISVISISTSFVMSSRGGVIFSCLALLILSNFVIKGSLVKVINTVTPLFVFFKILPLLTGSYNLERFEGLGEIEEDLRYELIRDSIERILNSPLGHGPGQFAFFDSHNGVSHNSLIYLAHDYGCFFVLLFILICLLWLRDLFKSKLLFPRAEFNLHLVFFVLIGLYSNLYIFVNNAYIFPFLICFSIMFKPISTTIRL
jgi:hypothetical protein